MTRFCRIKEAADGAAGKIPDIRLSADGLYDKGRIRLRADAGAGELYYGVMWNKLYRADLVRAHTDVRCSEEMTWSEDLYFNLTYIRYAERFFALTAPIYNYYDNPGSAVHLTKVRTAITARTALFSYYKELYEQLGLYEENKLQIFKYLISSSEA